jgi:hypothetical protein
VSDAFAAFAALASFAAFAALRLPPIDDRDDDIGVFCCQG